MKQKKINKTMKQVDELIAHVRDESYIYCEDMDRASVKRFDYLITKLENTLKGGDTK